MVVISKSDQKNEFVQQIIEMLSGLDFYGFSKPSINHDDWSTTLRFMLSDIALEVELDWKELDIFILVVRLEGGKLPSGYYISEGRPCRHHLQEIIAEQRWSVDQKALTEISSRKRSKKQSTKDDMLARFRAYEIVLDDCVENLVKSSDAVF